MRHHPTRRTALLSGLAAAAATGAAAPWFIRRAWSESGQRFEFHYEHVIGTSMDLAVTATDEIEADAAAAAVIASINRDAAILSGYDASSEFSRWFQTRDVAVAVSPELAEVLSLFDEWRHRSAGAVDPAAERISVLWQHASSAGRIPTQAERDAAALEVRQPHWRVNRETRVAEHLTSTPLMLHSFTKSYIAERAAEAALRTGAVGIVVNIGGDIVVRGTQVESVGVRNPLAPADNASPVTTISVRNRSIATSGGYRRGFDVGPVHYSHVLDPRTADATGHVLSATVVAARATDAGALATAMCVLSEDEGRQLAATVPGAEFLLVRPDGRRVQSAGWHHIEVPHAEPWTNELPGLVATLSAAEQTWDPNYELTITLDLARQGRRPYVAVWIEDKDRFPLRTLALWYEKPRWLADLRAWSRADRLRALAEGTNIAGTVASATRAPGRYVLTWDGKDQQGKLVKPGTYTVFIEAAREHGTYQVMRQEIDLSSSSPKHFDLPANTEIAATALDYHRIAGR